MKAIFGNIGMRFRRLISATSALLLLSSISGSGYGEGLGLAVMVDAKFSRDCANFNLWDFGVTESNSLPGNGALVRYFRGGKTGNMEVVSKALRLDGTREHFFKNIPDESSLLKAFSNVGSVRCAYSVATNDLEIYRIDQDVWLSYKDGRKKQSTMSLPFLKLCDASGCFISSQVDTQLLSSVLAIAAAGEGGGVDLSTAGSGRERTFSGKLQLLKSESGSFYLPVTFRLDPNIPELPNKLSKETVISRGGVFRVQNKWDELPRMVSDTIFWESFVPGVPIDAIGVLASDVVNGDREGIVVVRMSTQSGIFPLQMMGFRCEAKSCKYTGVGESDAWRMLSRFMPNPVRQ